MSNTKIIKVGDCEINVGEDYSAFTRDDLIRLYWQMHPRFSFFKFCQKGSVFLDIGAANGGLSFWKDWEQPNRLDIKMHGIDLEVGEFANRYEKFTVLNLDKEKLPYEDDYFTNIYSTHVVEHLKTPKFLIQNIHKKLRTGGTAYIESPNKNSLSVPKRNEFIRAGFNCTTMNFFDDSTHLVAYDKDDLEALFLNHGGFQVIGKGTIKNEYLKGFLLSYGYENQDYEITNYGLWLYHGWSDYIVVEKDE